MSKKQIDANLLEEGTSQTKINKNINSVEVDYSNAKWLKANDPMQFIEDGNKDIVSSKYDAEREPKVQSGLDVVSGFKLESGSKINGLMIQLARWWEVKPARNAIKKLIDEEAAAAGIEPHIYMQENLANEIEELSSIQTSIDRLRYAKTYFKPRGEVKSKIKTRTMKIDNVVYNVPEVQFLELSGSIKDKNELKKAILAISTEVEMEEL